MDKLWEIEHDQDTYINWLRKYIETFAPVEDKNWGLFSKTLIIRRFKKGEAIVDFGQVENYIYFLLKGAVMQVYSNQGQDHVMRFNFPGSFFNSYQSFMSRKPSLFRIEALGDVMVFSVSHSNLMETMKQIEDSKQFVDKMIQMNLKKKEQREIAFLSKSAEENYFDLIKTNPAIHKYVPLKHIASYLGIAPESLSRIRKKNGKQTSSDS